jgi:UDP-N-acetylmuramoylalanine--D-glutamate ligase
MSHGLATDSAVTRAALMELRHRPVHVIGAASAEGVAVMRLLVRLGFTDIVPHDMRARDVLRKAFRTNNGAYSRAEQDAIWEELQPLLANGRCGDAYLTGIGPEDVMSLGQGWYLDPHNRERIVAVAPPRGTLLSMSALYMALIPGPIAGITGTNGKSTTTAFVEHCWAVADRAVAVAGNERSSRQFLPDAVTMPADQWALLEISNRQLMQVSASPHVAAITALTPDHLEEHDGWEGYVATKQRMFMWQQPHDIAIACGDDPNARRVATRGSAQHVVMCGVGLDDDTAGSPRPGVRWIADTLHAYAVPVHAAAGGGHVDARLVSRSDIQLRGLHNLRNLAVGAAVALAMGLDVADVREALRTFTGKALRLEHLACIDGVHVWSDIKSTTPEATIAALDALFDPGVERAGQSADRTEECTDPAGKPIEPGTAGTPAHVHLIMGGDDKGLDYTPLAAAIAGRPVTAWAVPGSATDQFAACIHAIDAGAQLQIVESLPVALDGALSRAVAGDAVIVSPAAAGFWTTQLQGGVSLRTMIRRRTAHTSSTMEATNR